MEKCCLCGKEIKGRFSGANLSADCNRRICNECNDMKELVKFAKGESQISKYEKAFNYYNELIANETIEPTVLNEFMKFYGYYQERYNLHKAGIESKQAEIANSLDYGDFLCTTVNSLDGYDIKEYCGLAFGETILGTGFASETMTNISDMLGTRSTAMEEKIILARTDAMKELIERAKRNNANAVIGIKIDISVLAGNVISCSIVGTSVRVEKSC
ncbi:MAG: heavy metal-binding domain-containing protein [Erysipelotrichaceae bacterium]